MKSANFVTAAAAAKAVHCSKKTIIRRARREGWEMRKRANRFELVLPRRLAKGGVAPQQPFLHPIISEADRALLRRAALRFLAVAELAGSIDRGTGHEAALQATTDSFRFHISVSALRRWSARYAAQGFAGLMEFKRGRVGRKRKARR